MEAGTSHEPITVVITDDHAVVRQGLRLIIEAQSQMHVVAESSDLAGARAHLRDHVPDVLLLDVNLGGESGLDAIPSLRSGAPATAIVVLTMQNEPAYARRALEAGASGYVVKEAAGDELVRAIRAAANGQTYVQPELGGRLVHERLQPADEPLSPRELDVLRLLALGHTNGEIAKQLFLSVRTVESHRARLQEKLGIQGRAELVRYALASGVVER
jgi:two-component system response regulator NreC